MKRKTHAAARPKTAWRPSYAILLVEDEPILVSLYTSMLQKATSARIFTAREEREALKLVERELPMLMLLDLMIPTTVKRRQTYDFHEPVGFELLRRVKANPKTRNIRVVVLSNLDADEHRQRAQELGAEDYLVKALMKPRELGARVAGYLVRRSSSRRNA